MSDILQRRISGLNQAQRLAIEAILQGWDAPSGEFIFPIVEGPPGTGKTTVGVMASSQYQEEQRNPQIAYLCYTHYAADRALEAFIDLGLSADTVNRIVARGQERRFQNSPHYNYYMAYNNINNLTPNQVRQLRRTPILITTLHGARRIFQIQNRPLIVMDEFSQVSPTLFFSAISKVRRSTKNPQGYVLLGDPNQLPVITSQPFLRPNIGIFIASRGDFESHELTTQYRMHLDICQVVNSLREALHTYPLETHPSNQNRNLNSLGYRWNASLCPPNFQEIISPDNPSVIINTDNLSGRDEESLGGSKHYTSEAQLAARLGQIINETFTDPNGNHLTPTILSPYRSQVGMIRSFLPQNLRGFCTTIYYAQGREYPCVIISFARKNPEGLIGFLGETQLRAQTYVACSRAMAKLIVLFSFSTFRGYIDYDVLLERSGSSLIIDAEPSWGD